MVEARPKLENLKAVLMVYSVKVLEAYPGPPEVMTKGMSKTCMAPRMLSKRTKSTISAMEGVWIYRNICQELAPSMVAASTMSWFTDWSAAMKRTMW